VARQTRGVAWLSYGWNPNTPRYPLSFLHTMARSASCGQVYRRRAGRRNGISELAPRLVGLSRALQLCCALSKKNTSHGSTKDAVQRSGFQNQKRSPAGRSTGNQHMAAWANRAGHRNHQSPGAPSHATTCSETANATWAHVFGSSPQERGTAGSLRGKARRAGTHERAATDPPCATAPRPPDSGKPAAERGARRAFRERQAPARPEPILRWRHTPTTHPLPPPPINGRLPSTK
jgi:hypothetical protein